jgi:glycosyltransferase involved in cell wall biosynthesis
MLRQSPGTVYGGSELRAWRFARGLADRGFTVSLTSFTREPISPDVLGPVTVIEEPAPARRWSGLRRRQLASDPSAVWERADADAYVAFGAADYSALLAHWCRGRGRPLVLMAGSDADFAADYRPGNIEYNPYGSRCDLCYEAVVSATEIVVQTAAQHRLARDRFAREARIITNPVELPSLSSEGPNREHVLWVGKSDRVKRPEIAVEVARLCPAIGFRLIVNRVDGPSFDQLMSEAPSNVAIVESVPPQDMARQYAGAIALLNTSRFEGFPNAVLEAGSFGVPLLSLCVDPGEIISREGGGALADGDVATLAELVRRYHADPALARAAGRRLQSYVRQHHEASARIGELADLIREIVRRPGQRIA